MKKFFGILIAGLVCLAFAMPAAAVENEFGGYWRTRAISMKDFDGSDSGTQSYVDTRTRLFYTAKFNDKFKFVNKFEIDNGWGDNDGGDIGTDGKNFEIKNSYADFFIGDHNFKVGLQPGKIARGFLFDDDFAGITATFKIGSFMVPFMWMKAKDNDFPAGTPYPNPAGHDRDYLAVSPVFNLSDSLSVNPYLLIDKEQGTDTTLFYIGADVNAKLDDNLSAWGTFILEAGEKYDKDCTAFLVAAGVDAGLIHGQFFYASGENDDPSDRYSYGGDNFGLHSGPGKGATYYWAEIMGEGIFDGVRSNNAPGTRVSNVMAANIGATVKPIDKLTLTGDVWYARLAEKRYVRPFDPTSGKERDLGLEIDLKASYMLLDNLKLDVVAAYLFAGDATGKEDPIELGAQLSFSF